MQKERYYSLDVFRGLTIALMILVNNPGSWTQVYPMLLHAEWNGYTPTDLIFPFFLFAVGNALSFVMPRLRTAGEKIFLKKVFKRSLLIFTIGLLLNWFPFFKWEHDTLVFKQWESVRIMGVLQRIALAYLIASLVIYYFKNRGVLLFSCTALLGYAILCYSYNADIQANWFGAEIDKLILGATHLYQGEGIPFDPEGLIGTLNASVQITLGYLVGVYIQKKGKTIQMLRGLLIAGLGLLAVAYLVHMLTPFNKKIWTSSYVLLSTAWAILLITGIIYLIEFRQLKGIVSRFFDVFGKNPLFIFVISGVIPRFLGLFPIQLPEQNVTLLKAFYLSTLQPFFTDERNASIAYALLFLITMWLLAYILDKRNIYIKV